MAAAARPLARQPLRLAGLSAMLVLLLGILGGCGDDDRKPIPVLEVVVLGDGSGFTFNDRHVDLAQLKAELRRVADETRRPVTNTCRAYVRLIVRPGADQVRADEVTSFCQGIGLVQIENQAIGN
jgi:hypothetical protein